MLNAFENVKCKIRCPNLVLFVFAIKYEIHNDASVSFAIMLITISSTGKQYIMRDGYTYYRHLAMKVGYRWSCTHSSRCNARIIVDDNGRVLSTNGEHLHPPPKYHVLPNGTYVKV
ncbi:hypothetical protein ABMA28_001378 [Loxostege sticticalis]|uniref:FLYWCH-type domain-containing protein n=1 Tax=Loxostege sticticalis TaxID=481309 RepID=A0ABD0T465_LOXSC